MIPGFVIFFCFGKAYGLRYNAIYMKTFYWILGIAIVLVLGFYALNSYIYNEKQGDPVPTENTAKTEVEITPISHASFVMGWGTQTVYVDPVGAPEAYTASARPDIIVITHEHQDHFSTSTLSNLTSSSTVLIVPQIIADKLPENLKTHLVVLKNGEKTNQGDLTIEAVPAYNLREEDKTKHPEGGGNGYVIDDGKTRVYIAGDTEDTPEMRALQNIDMAFVPMNLPYTMSVEKAADAVLAFKPTKVYPYHFRTPTGFSDVVKFKQLVNAGNSNIEVVQLEWYPSQ